MAFGFPDMEISWDGGDTWYVYANAIGTGCLGRIRTPDGKTIWTGRAEEYLETCGGCDGTGKSKRLRFVASEPGEK